MQQHTNNNHVTPLRDFSTDHLQELMTLAYAYHGSAEGFTEAELEAELLFRKKLMPKQVYTDFHSAQEKMLADMYDKYLVTNTKTAEEHNDKSAY